MRQEIIKTVLNSLLALATLLATAFFWKAPLITCAILLLCGIIMMRLENEKHVVVIYIIGFLFGPISEVIAMMSGAWSYAQNHILTIPIWLPFIWGNAALYINRLNKFIGFIRTATGSNPLP